MVNEKPMKRRLMYGGFGYFIDPGIPHRIDGPAFEFADGTKSWYINGEEMSKMVWLDKLKELDIK